MPQRRPPLKRLGLGPTPKAKTTLEFKSEKASSRITTRPLSGLNKTLKKKAPMIGAIDLARRIAKMLRNRK